MAKSDNELRVDIKMLGGILGIILILASAVGAAYITYDTSKSNRVHISALELRVRENERRQDKFEGIMEERTKNILEHVAKVEDFMQRLNETWEFVDGEENSYEEATAKSNP